MKKIIVILFLLLNGGLFSQNFNKGFHIILQGVDSSYFDEQGLRWNEFSLTPRKYYKVMDLIESDTTCGCTVIKGNKAYVSYLKQYGRYDKEDKKFYKKVFGFLDCETPDQEIYMWVSSDEAFGYIVTNSLN
jgi:hypothetical protein